MSSTTETTRAAKGCAVLALIVGAPLMVILVAFAIKAIRWAIG